MVKNVVDILNHNYDRTTQTVTFPTCFDNIKSDDANFELVASNTLQKVKLARRHNVVKKSTAVIFAHTNVGNMIIDDNTIVNGQTW